MPDGNASRPTGATSGAATAPRRPLVDAILSAPERHHLICAPAGYGKTCLLGEIERRLEARGATVRRLGPTPTSAPLDIEETARSEFVLVDNAADPRVLEAIARLTAPDSAARVVMAARARPALQTAEMELQERLRIWTHLDLRCDADDVLALFAGLGEPDAPRSIGHDIARDAEGWIAGAKFLALQRTADRRNGRNVDAAASLAAYFDETILRPLPEAQHRQLLLASICDELCVPLFERITGGTDLAAITDAGALLFPSPGRPGWRCFHRLFRKHLAMRAQALGRDVLARAHRAAAEWRLAAGAVTDAAAHALECDDTRFAADVIDRGARAFIANGQISEALAWLDRLPAVEHDGRPRIRLFYVTALAAAGRLEEADRANEQVLSRLHDGDAPPERAAEIAAHARYHDELIAFVRNAEEIDLRRIDALLQDTAGRQKTVYGEALLLKGGILHRQGDFASARAAILDSLAHVEASASWYALTIGQMVLAQIDCDAGATQQAEDRCAALINDLAQWTSMRIPAMAPAAIMLARLAYARNDLDTAARWLGEAAELLPALQNPEWDFERRLIEARLACAQGRWEEGLRLSEALHGLAHRLQRPIVIVRASALAATIYIALGRLDDARQQIDDAQAALRGAPSKSFWRARGRLAATLAEHRLKLAEGAVPGLAGQTHEALAAARQCESAPMLLQALLAHATTLFESGDEARAFRTLREALKLGEQSRNARAFLDFADASFQRLLVAYRRKRGRQDIADDAWLTAVGNHGEGPDEESARRAASACNAPLAISSDLTPKELEVLQLAAEGRNNQEIAEELFISVATVKWHVGNILSKLDASNRSAAIARARQLRMLH